ncbi:mediator of RNA polymerase II transcription subunit 24 isoform X2 [Folsomia candida]|uniref:mediator of RNA polymerase II transcription subunit 24 isoform X2 n=1 Tax=Folsomia candida TaxID=158441 RepID=UPI001604E716|nr:mediator of RNA polymerase II transcription subunit 24 isoform X2 [Folsomia candida]
MVMQSKELILSRDAQAKNIIMRAWRERWTVMQWGINVRTLVDSKSDGSFIANCILQQGGPGPNSLVLSYLMHSIYSQLISSCAVLKSVCKYDGFHKPYCVASLLDLLNNIKERVILNENEDLEQCMELSQSLALTTHWLLTCMYSSLENLSDLSINDFPVDVEDSKIVIKCRKLLEYFLTNPFISGLINCAVLENDEMFQNIKKMSGEIAKFADGHHHQDIAFITGLIEQIGERRGDCISSRSILTLSRSIDGRQTLIGSPSILTTIISAALFRSSENVADIANELQIIKNLRGLTNVELFNEIMHAAVVSLVDCLGKPNELQILGFVFLVLPSLLKSLVLILDASNDDFCNGLCLFLDNDSVLSITDTKLACYTLDIFLVSFQKLNIISDGDRKQILEKKPRRSLQTDHSSNNAVLLLETEKTLQHIFNALDGVSDFEKNKDAILGTLYDVICNNFEFVLTTTSCTNKLKQLSSKLLKLNQYSLQAVGENGKTSATRAMIFDITFLMLCSIGQTYGVEALASDESDYFFVEWYNECMVENNSVKNPDAILNRCNQNKVEILINTFLQGESELKTSLVFWNELCTNVVGVIRDMVFAWEAESANFADVKKVLDVIRSKVCSLPICISAWLCSYIQMSPENQSGKARYILNHFLSNLNVSNDEEHFQERFAVMNKVISKMINCVQPTSGASSPISTGNCTIESKPMSDLYKKCFSSMQSRGLIDIDTMISLQSLLDLNGLHYFVQGLITEMMENQSPADLLQWCDMLYGLFKNNLFECTAALLGVVIPSLLHYWDRDSNFVEPQILALVSLTVDCILSCYLQGETIKTLEDSDDEPSLCKRRKISDPKDSKKMETLENLKYMLRELYEELDKILKATSDARPQGIFVLRFLEQLSIKASDPTIFSSLPHSVITNLMSLMSDDINPQMLLGWHSLNEKTGRANCILTICNLMKMQNVNRHCCDSSSD